MAWLSGFNNRLKLTIPPDNVDSSLTDFPVMINLSSAAGKNSFDATAVFDELGDINKKRIAITKNDGTTQCPVEIEYWDATEERAVMWTKVPTIYSTVDTDLYFYYDATYSGTTTSGNTTYVGDTGDAAAQNVWDDNFVGVWHMAQDPSGGSGCILDSTSNTNHGSTTGTMNSGDLIDGQIGKALDMDGSDDSIAIVDPVDGGFDVTYDMSIEVIINPTSLQVENYGMILNKSTINSTWNLFVDLTYYKFYIVASYGTVLSTTEWAEDANHYVVSTYDGANTMMYVQGIQEDSAVYTGAIPTNNNPLYIGGQVANNNMTGLIDEVRFSNIARSAPWIKATYHSNWDNFVVFQEEEITTNWLTDWSKRIKLTIDHTKIDSTLVDFPINVTLVSGTNTEDVFTELTTVSGTKKIAITESDGTSQCYIEIEYWNWSEQEAVLWTKVPTVKSDEDTVLYLYYDSTKSDNDTYIGDTGTSPAQQVWDSNFVGVFHLALYPTWTITNSTSVGINATSVGSMTADDLVDGKIGKAIDFDESDDYLETASADDVFNITTTVTLESTIKPTYTLDSGLSTSKGICSRSHIPNADQDSYAILINDSGKLHFGSYGGNIQSTTASWSNLSWHYVAGTYNSSGLIGDLFVNGVKETLSVDNYDAIAGATNSFIIGANAVANLFPGIIEEVRVSDIVRLDAWIKATYYSNWNTLITYDSATTKPIFLFNGYVKVESIPAARTVHLFRRSTGELMDTIVSNSSTGYFELGSYYNDYHFLVILPELTETYDLIAHDKIDPGV